MVPASTENRELETANWFCLTCFHPICRALKPWENLRRHRIRRSEYFHRIGDSGPPATPPGSKGAGKGARTTGTRLTYTCRGQLARYGDFGTMVTGNVQAVELVFLLLLLFGGHA